MPEHSRRSARAAASRDDGRPARAKRPILKSAWFWVPASLVFMLLVVGGVAAVVGMKLADRAFAARDALQSAIPLATTAKDQVIAGDSAGAKATVAQLAALTTTAREQAGGQLWGMGEAIPLFGNNLTAVRVVSATVDDLVTDALTPATELSIASFAPKDGRIDTAALAQASVVVDKVASGVAAAQSSLEGLNREGLIDQVAGGLDQLEGVLDQIEPMLEPAQKALAVLPAILGESAPRNYLVLVQNNAESRGTGGNPAALVLLNVDNGAISITQQAASTDFKNGRKDPIIALDPGTVALYGDKVGRYVQDATTTVNFRESAQVVTAYWAEEFDNPIDGVLSIDPVALSYFLRATGPVTMLNGETLTAGTAVDRLLNGVYLEYGDYSLTRSNQILDAYFAMAASSIFDALTTVQDPRALIDQVMRAVNEGRLLYSPSSLEEAELIAGTRMTGTLPIDNAEHTMVGAYINDISEGKLDYYVDTTAGVSSDVCTVASGAAPSFTVVTSVASSIQPGDARELSNYISPGRYFPKGTISTDVVLYGPVGAAFASASVDGQPVAATPVEHLGRPAVKINIINDPATTHTVSATFTGVAGETYGPLEVWHTPMVRDTPITIDAPGCAATE